MNIEGMNLSPRGDKPYAVIKKPSRLETRQTAIGVFSEKKRDVAVQEDVAQPNFQALQTLRERSESSPLPIGKGAATPPSLEPIVPADQTIRAELIEAFKFYMKPEENEGLSSSLKRVSGFFKDTLRLSNTSSHEIDKDAAIKKELERVFKLLKHGREKGIALLDISEKEENKKFRLDVLLDLLMKHEPILRAMDNNPTLRKWAHGFVLSFILEDFNQNAKELIAFLQQLSPKMEQLVTIFGRSFELQVDDGRHSINAYEKFVNINSPTLLMKNVALARVNAEQIMASLRRGDKTEKLVSRSGEVKEIYLQESSVIYDNSFEVYKTLVELLLPALKYTEESIAFLIEDVLGRYIKAKKLKKEDLHEIKESFKLAWPVGDKRTSNMVDWESVLRIVHSIVALVKTSESFFQHSEWIKKCLRDATAVNITEHIYSLGDTLVMSPKDFFQKLNPEEKANLKTYLISLIEELTSDLEQDKVKLENMVAKAHCIAALL